MSDHYLEATRLHRERDEARARFELAKERVARAVGEFARLNRDRGFSVGDLETLLNRLGEAFEP